MKLIIENLNVNYSNKLKVNEYSIRTDPIIKQAIKLNKDELKTTNKCFLTDRLNKLNINEQQQQHQEEESLSSISSSSSNSISCQNSWFTRSFKERKTVKTKRLIN